jgi:hypothetical protein
MMGLYIEAKTKCPYCNQENTHQQHTGVKVLICCDDNEESDGCGGLYVASACITTSIAKVEGEGVYAEVKKLKTPKAPLSHVDKLVINTIHKTFKVTPPIQIPNEHTPKGTEIRVRDSLHGPWTGAYFEDYKGRDVYKFCAVKTVDVRDTYLPLWFKYAEILVKEED